MGETDLFKKQELVDELCWQLNSCQVEKLNGWHEADQLVFISVKMYSYRYPSTVHQHKAPVCRLLQR